MIFSQKTNLSPQEKGKVEIFVLYVYNFSKNQVQLQCTIATSLLITNIYQLIILSSCNLIFILFFKGYYPRVAQQKMNGRVTRLLVTPLLKSLQKILGHNEYLTFLDCFKYPLAGEFSFKYDLLNDIRIPHDWGLEIGILSEMYRNFASNRICQVDIADTYEHKHQGYQKIINKGFI